MTKRRKKLIPLLLIDFYKACHSDMLPNGITKSVSYFTNRGSRIEKFNEVVVFGLQAFCKEYLIDYFNEHFFEESLEEVCNQFRRTLTYTLGKEGEAFNTKKIEDLHNLGYLPIEIVAVPEGLLLPVKNPVFGITNTHKDFAWLPQALESLISAELWHMATSATVGHEYRKIVNKWYDKTCEDFVPRRKALGDFSFRGQECRESAVKSSSAWALSFVNTATVPALDYLERNYNCNCEKEEVIFGAVSTEHSVMCSNFAVDGDEETLLRRLLTEVYKNTSFSAVLDSYDYWNVVDNILPKLKKEILHDHCGTFLIRGDSGDCVDVVTKTVFKLWDIFGGSVNSKGYMVLNPHVKAIYGDSITLERCEKIYEILEANGFACSNVVLGVGSFSMQGIENNGRVEPFTRDTFNSCIKATYCEIDGKPYPIFKAPKEASFKKSQKGCCRVYINDEGNIVHEDGLTWEQASESKDNLLKSVFKDGKLIKEYSLREIRQRLNNCEF